ncbi:TrbC/VirB2 family protein [Campylobacter taeniopygiae]|uniref:Conjugal transfer protein TraC n=1 Tax=Campylobacter taeniopygiae TaxID=2510188 RepID=A0ABY2TJ03_9BACT|nr:TrbC/VirB2 family protein [Campylobacter taeniopygiae]TKX33275.1 conjugal transfer protein TraC [Campylobacter taeniopygiae]
MKKVLLSLILLIPVLAFGAGGIDKVNTFMENLSSALYALGAVLLTIAFMWGGSKIMFQGQTLREVAPIFIGGVIFGSASAIAGYIIT